MNKVIWLLLAGFHFCAGQGNDLNYYLSEARKSYAAKDYPRSLEMISAAHKLHPYHQGILYQLGILSALNQKPEEAVKNLRRAIFINADYKLN